MNTEEEIWSYLKGQGLTDAGTAGLMGNLYAESGLHSNNLQNSYEGKLGYADDEYTEMVDKGAYTNFANDRAGYGLCQWTYPTRKAALLAYAKAADKSIGDLDMQLGFLMKELTEGYKAVLNILKNAATVKAASDCVLLQFERPADQSEAVRTKRAGYGQTYYDKYASKAAKAGTGGVSMTETEVRKKFVNFAVSYLGCKESDGSHKKIIDLYNSHEPLAQGYAVKYTDAWCATYVSAMAIGADLTDIIPLECGCDRYIELAKKAGIWVEDDAYVPKMGDIVLYDWQDGTNYAATDNTGSADHIGIVVSVSGNTIKIIEGNISDAVGYRNLQMNGRYIRGWVTPKYSSVSTVTTAAPVSSGENTETAAFKVGDKVQFNGSKHYANAVASSGSTAKPGPAKITALSLESKHPYHIIHTDSTSNVYGWVDAADISSTAATVKTYTVKKGDSLWAIAAKQLGSGSRYKEIKALNSLTSDTIQIGQVLKLPS